MDNFGSALFEIAPTILVGLIFWFIMWAIIRADRHERAAQARIEQEERARLAVGSPSV
ncbi:MAG: lysyl-tRNA synthetase [Naasia sp.]|jgi:hypothetical protein|uniref:hypothetical protein n=1 Tax=Naasia sp. TaxID=2546198 RepID=UPI00261191EA|nr:hypothetical protein [Naasia sp.]MCU1571183.1 lysyl-tRNA synthetase [Naasia sp.]